MSAPAPRLDYLELARRLDGFKTSPLGVALCLKAGWAAVVQRATGISLEEYERLEAAYYDAWWDGKLKELDKPAVEIAHAKPYERPTCVCGFCGVEFGSERERAHHEEMEHAWDMERLAERTRR